MRLAAVLIVTSMCLVPHNDAEAQGSAAWQSIVSVNPLVSGRPLTADFEVSGRDARGNLAIRSYRLIRDTHGRVRQEYQLAEIPGVGPLRYFVVYDPVARKNRIGTVPSGLIANPKPDIPSNYSGLPMYAILGGWEIDGPIEETEVDGFECHHMKLRNNFGQLLEAWVAIEDRILLRVDGSASYSWRLVSLDRTEPDESVFAAGDELD